MRKAMLFICLMTAIAASAQENWEDSVKVYQEQIHEGDASGYEKLARCYLEGKGVDHNFPQAFWLILQVASEIGEERANQFFLNISEDDVDRVKYEAAKAFVMGDAQKLRDVNKRLAEIDAGSGELVEGLLNLIEKKSDEASMHFSKAIELGCKFAALFKGAIQQPYSEEKHISTLLELAKDYPFVYCSLGDMMVNATDPVKRAKAIEYYKMANEYACLSKEGRTFLERQSDRNDNLSAVTEEDEYEEMISDSISIESVKDDFDLEIKEVELTDRYGVTVQGGKYGIRDFEKQENVTEIMYDEAYPSYRKKVMDEYITYFYIRVGNQSGVVGITESSNQTMTIMAPPQKE